MIAWRSLWIVAALSFAVAVGCSSAGSGPVVTPTQSPGTGPSGSPTPAPSSTRTGTPGSTPTPSATPSAAGSPTPSPLPTASLAASLTSIVVCAQTQQTCGVDLNANAGTGEEAVVLVKGVVGTLSASNSGGPTVATITQQVYSTSGGSTEYAVNYKTATATAATDTLTIDASGSGGTLTIPVTILAPGNDTGPDFFALDTTSGTVCPGNQLTFGTTAQGGAPIVLATSDSTLVTIAQNGGPNYILNLLRAGSGYVTASAGSASIVYPANIPLPGFTSGC